MTYLEHISICATLQMLPNVLIVFMFMYCLPPAHEQGGENKFTPNDEPAQRPPQKWLFSLTPTS